MKKQIPFTAVRDLRNEETLQMLAELWADRIFREYTMNLRNIEIQNLKKIKTGTIEGDALELQRNNGRIEAIEKLMSVAQTCYENFEKMKAKRKLVRSDIIGKAADEKEPYAV